MKSPSYMTSSTTRSPTRMKMTELQWLENVVYYQRQNSIRRFLSRSHSRMGRGSSFDDYGGHPGLNRTMSSAKRQFNLRKTINPFISSTFLDFQAERDYLVKKIFPAIDALCRERGTHFTPIDLRWGINDSQANSGHVIQLCLDYIQRSAPFFICLLGERYGSHRDPGVGLLPDRYEELPQGSDWLDKNYMVAASSGHDWVLQEAHQHCSITELEIIQAAFLNDPEHCFFYCRQEDHIDGLFTDLPEEERSEKLIDFTAESDYASAKMKDLKARIAKKGLPVKYFKTPEELGRILLNDWVNVIDKLYPPLTVSLGDFGGEQFKEWTAHEAFAETRRRVFVPTTELQHLMDELTAFGMSALDDPPMDFDESLPSTKHLSRTFSMMRKKKQPDIKYKSIMVLEGERGMGKTSVLANWVKDFADTNKDIKVLSHYVGSSALSTDIAAFMRRCIIDLREEYHSSSAESDIATTTEDLADFHRICEAFLAAVSMGPCVLLIDGIDELGSSYGLTPLQVKDMSWLPIPLPPQCKMIVTTATSDLTYKSLALRGDVIPKKVPSLSEIEDKRKVMEEHLAMHCKSLNEEQLDRIVQSKLSKRPLFLAVLAHELRVFGVYNRLDYHLNSYLEAKSIRDLWAKIIERWIREYGWTTDSTGSESSVSDSKDIEMVGWVADALRLIACSRHGLSQVEILEALKQLGYQGSSEVTAFDMALFRSAAMDSLFERPGGLLNFFHQHFKEAVEYTLLGSVTPSSVNLTSQKPALIIGEEISKRKFHEHLATFFQGQEHSIRRTEELPFQLEMSGDLDGLCTLMSDPSIFLEMLGEYSSTQSRKLDLIHYWRVLTEADFNPGQTYHKMLVEIGALDVNAVGKYKPVLSPMVSGLPKLPSEGSQEWKDLPSPLRPASPRILITHTSDLSAVQDLNSDSKDDVDGLDDDITDSSVTSDTSRDSLPEVFSPNLLEAYNEKKTNGFTKHELASIAKHAGEFLTEMGYFDRCEEMLLGGHHLLIKNFPLEHEDFRLLCSIEECIADLYLSQQRKVEAQKWYKKALRTLPGFADNELEADDFYLAEETKGRLLQRMGHIKVYDGQYDEAEELLTEAQACMEQACSTTGKATVMYHMGVLRMCQREYIKAESCFRDALNIREQWYGKSHPYVAEVLDDLGNLICDTNNEKGYDKSLAEDLYRRAMEIREQCLGTDHLKVAKTLYQLGILLKSSGNYFHKMEAKELLKRSLDIRTQKLGADHKITKCVRKSLQELEKTLQSGQYEYGSSKPADKRSANMPYSGLSWREQDLNRLEMQSKSRMSEVVKSEYIPSRASRTRSSTSPIGRPVSRLDSFFDDESMSPVEDVNVIREDAVWTGNEKNEQNNNDKLTLQLVPTQSEWKERKQKKLQRTDAIDPANFPTYIDSFSPLNRKLAMRRTKNPLRNRLRPKSSPVGEKFGRVTNVQFQQPTSPTYLKLENLRLNSGGTSRNTWKSNVSQNVHRGTCYVPGEHTIDTNNAYTVNGPHSGIESLMGPPPCPRDQSHGVHHRSAWYHVPGRYNTANKPFPPRKSQVRYNIPSPEPKEFSTPQPTTKQFDEWFNREILSDFKNGWPASTVTGGEDVPDGPLLNNKEPEADIRPQLQTVTFRDEYDIDPEILYSI